MNGFRSGSVFNVLERPYVINRVKLGRDVDMLRHDARVVSLVVGHQRFKYHRVRVEEYFRVNPTGKGSHRGRIQAAAHSYSYFFRSEAVGDGGFE